MVAHLLTVLVMIGIAVYGYLCWLTNGLLLTTTLGVGVIAGFYAIIYFLVEDLWENRR